MSVKKLDVNVGSKSELQYQILIFILYWHSRTSIQIYSTKWRNTYDTFEINRLPFSQPLESSIQGQTVFFYKRQGMYLDSKYMNKHSQYTISQKIKNTLPSETIEGQPTYSLPLMDMEYMYENSWKCIHVWWLLL